PGRVREDGRRTKAPPAEAQRSSADRAVQRSFAPGSTAMTIWDLCIRRPIFTAMLVSAPLVLGLVSYRRLGVDLFPNVDLPVVTVTTALRGAGVAVMETQVTKPIEEVVNTVSGIDELRSTTKEGFSQVVVQFVLEKDGAVAAQEVDARIRTIMGRL